VSTRLGGSFRMPIERSRIREFSRACLSENPDYVDDENPVIPPTFLSSRFCWLPDGVSSLAHLGVDVARVLHGGVEYVFHGPPPRAGTELTFETRVDRVSEKTGARGGAMALTEVVTEFRGPAGDLVAQARSTLIEPEHAAS